jgi:hypothetical protein
MYATEQMRLTSTGLGIGTSSPNSKLTVEGGQVNLDPNIYITQSIRSTAAYNASPRSGLAFAVKYNSGGSFVYGASIQGYKNNATDGDYGVGLLFTTQANGSSPTQSATLDASGNLGLGVTPSAWDSAFDAFQLNTTGCIASTSNRTFVGQNWYDAAAGGRHLANGFALRYDQIGANGSHAWYTSTSGTAGNAITFTQAMTLDASGNLGVGVTNPSVRLDVRGSSPELYVAQSGSSNGVSLAWNNGDASVRLNTLGAAWPIKILQNNTEISRFDSSGNLLVGTTSNLSGTYRGAFVSSGNVIGCQSTTNSNFVFSGINSTNSVTFSVTGGGTVTATSLGTGTVYSNSGTLTNTNPSDERLKDDIQSIGWGLEQVMALRPVSYKWKTDTINQGTQYGFIAQEVQSVMPELVREFETTDGEEIVVRFGLEKDGIYASMVKAIQEQQAIIESLKARLDAANL